MILPSNDSFVANGNPLEHPIFGADGSFQDSFQETGSWTPEAR